MATTQIKLNSDQFHFKTQDLEVKKQQELSENHEDFQNFKILYNFGAKRRITKKPQYKSQKKNHLNKQNKKTRGRQCEAWKSEDITNYWKFYLKVIISRPFQQLSWKSWKVDNIFIKMAKELKKTSQQCKSFDQRMKNDSLKNLSSSNINQVAIYRLNEHIQKRGPNSLEICQLLQQFKRVANTQSQHMLMLEENLQDLKKQNQLIQQIDVELNKQQTHFEESNSKNFDYSKVKIEHYA